MRSDAKIKDDYMNYFNRVHEAKRQRLNNVDAERFADRFLADSIPSGEDVMDQPDNISLCELRRMECS